MSDVIKLVVLGDPRSQKRHRTTRVNGFMRNYDPSASDKGDFLSIVQANAPEFPFQIPLKIEVNAYFSRPSSHFGTGKNAGILKKNSPVFHVSAPDSDNICKFCMDALNKIFWKDDRLICQVSINKMYDANPRTEITISPAEIF